MKYFRPVLALIVGLMVLALVGGAILVIPANGQTTQQREIRVLPEGRAYRNEFMLHVDLGLREGFTRWIRSQEQTAKADWQIRINEAGSVAELIVEATNPGQELPHILLLFVFPLNSRGEKPEPAARREIGRLKEKILQELDKLQKPRAALRDGRGVLILAKHFS